MRFRTKTVLGVAIIEVILLAVLISSVLTVLRATYQSELIHRVQLGGKLLAAAAKDAVLGQDLATLDSLAGEAMASGQIDFVRILDDRGTVLAERGDAIYLARTFQQDTQVDQVSDEIFDWSSPIKAGGIQYGEVRLSVSTAPLTSLLASTKRWAAGIAGLEMLLVAVFSWLLGSYLARQLVALRNASAKLSAGDFEYRVPVSGNDELAETAIAFNHMAEQLGESHNQLSAENRMRLETLNRLEFSLMQTEDRTEQLNAIFALSPDGFVTFDKSFRVKYANPAFFRMTLLGQTDIIGLDLVAFLARLVRQCVKQTPFPNINALKGLRKTGNDGADEGRQLIEMAGPDKRVLEIGIRISDAKTVSQILYFRDVTHETEVDRIKSEFLSHAAHELRTPMASILGFSELLLVTEFDQATQRDLLETIHRQSMWLVDIINELLDLSRIEAKRGQDIDIVDVDLTALVGDTVANQAVSKESQQIKLDLPDASTFARADVAKLRQALTNVISNAIKYSPAGGEIRVAIIPEQSRIGITVKDQGIGMTPAQMGHFGERFWRADSSGNIPGTGLGITIVKEALALMGGSLEVDSQLGIGTTITLWLTVGKP